MHLSECFLVLLKVTECLFQVLDHPLLMLWLIPGSIAWYHFPCGCINSLLLVWAASFLPPPGVVMKVQLVSSLSNLCFLYCCLDVQGVLWSKSFVFYIVKKRWLKIVLVPKCVGNRLQVIQKLVLFQRIRFWMFDQMKVFLNCIGLWPFKSKQLRSLGKCLYFENKEKPKQLLGQYNCSNHLSTGETGSWHQSVA